MSRMKVLVVAGPLSVDPAVIELAHRDDWEVDVLSECEITSGRMSDDQYDVVLLEPDGLDFSPDMFPPTLLQWPFLSCAATVGAFINPSLMKTIGPDLVHLANNPVTRRDFLDHLGTLLTLRQPRAERIGIDNLIIDLKTSTVELDGEPIALTEKEFLLLRYLTRNRNRVVSRTNILEQVWGYQFDTESNVVDVNINNLRRKLRDRKHELIQTVRGSGYMLKTL